MAEDRRDAKQTAAEIAKRLDSELLHLAKQLGNARLQRVLELASKVARAHAIDPENPPLDQETLDEIDIVLQRLTRTDR